MKLTISASFICLLLGSILRAQSPADKTQLQMFHIQGTVGSHEPGAFMSDVTFQSKQVTKTVTTNAEGFYEAALPLGNYIMTAVSHAHCHGKYSLSSHRPLFRVTSSMNVTLNTTLKCEVVCHDCGDESFSIPAEDGTPFKLAVQFGEYKWGFTGTHWYRGDSEGGDPVFVDYNLSSLQADHVTYHKKQKTIEAWHQVVLDDGLGKPQRFDSALFKIENGTLTRIELLEKKEHSAFERNR